MKVLFKRFNSKACCPEKSTGGSAVYNLFSARNLVIEPSSMPCVETDKGFSFLKKYFAKIHPRSGLSSRSIDNVEVVLHNLCNKQVEFYVGNRITQVVFQMLIWYN